MKSKTETRTIITEADISALVKAFYARVRGDDLLAPVFAQHIASDAWPLHEAHIADFWSNVFLGTGRFEGNPMRKHLALETITPAHFERWLGLFSQTAEERLSADKAQAVSAMANKIARSFQMGLAFHHNKIGRQVCPFSAYLPVRPD